MASVLLPHLQPLVDAMARKSEDRGNGLGEFVTTFSGMTTDQRNEATAPFLRALKPSFTQSSESPSKTRSDRDSTPTPKKINTAAKSLRQIRP
jgi:hypothetical protein